MNSTFLRFTAGLMIVGAIITALVGYRMTNKGPAKPIKMVTPTYERVVARQDFPMGHRMKQDDMQTIKTTFHDDQTFSDPADLAGKVLISNVSKGAPFKHSHFTDESSLGGLVAANERAVAIKVNEVIGVGGFVKPGDHVDVLLYLRTDRETKEVSSAQVILTNIRVLAYGSLVSGKEAVHNVVTSPSMSNKLGVDQGRSNIHNEKDGHSAILAVAEKDVSKLMLADSTGVLRLALRGSTSSELTTQDKKDNQFIRLSDISQVSDTPANAANTAIKAPRITHKNLSSTKHAKREKVFVHRGDTVEVVEVGNFDTRHSD